MCGSVDLTHVLVLAPLCMFMGMCVYLSMCVCTWVWRRRVRRGWDRPRVSQGWFMAAHRSFLHMQREGGPQTDLARSQALPS